MLKQELEKNTYLKINKVHLIQFPIAHIDVGIMIPIMDGILSLLKLDIRHMLCQEAEAGPAVELMMGYMSEYRWVYRSGLVSRRVSQLGGGPGSTCQRREWNKNEMTTS